jgi:4-amino-4-deoxy-L-arabinose transferase-like glycosyltransferase
MSVIQKCQSMVAAVRRRETVWLVGAGVVAWAVMFGRLGYTSLLDPDEAHYAQLTREMMRAHSWMVPLLDGSPFIDKPVLFHWLQIASVWLFGESALALRLPSFLGGIFLVCMTRWLASEMFGAATGNIAAVMFATLPFTFALANVALFDMVYTAFLFGAVACLVVSAAPGRRGVQYTGYALLTLAVMTKGPVALLLVMLWAGVAVTISPVLRQRLLQLQWRTGLLLVAVLASPWFVYMYVRFDGRFVQDYLLAGNLWYFTAPKQFSTRANDYTFYLRTFAGAFFPWSLVAVGYMLDGARLRRRTHERLAPDEALLVLWVVGILGFFSLARFKLDWYIFPAAPACCVLAARGWLYFADTVGRWTRVAITCTGIVFVSGGLIVAVAIFQINLGVARAAIVVPIALVCGGATILWQLARDRFQRSPSVAIPTATLLVVYAAAVMVGFPVLERSRPTAPIGRWVRRHTQPGTVVGVYGLDDWRGSIRYYTERPTVPLREPAQVQAFLRSAPNAYVLMLRSDYEQLRGQGTDIVEIAGRPAIVGRSGKYLRHQIWGTLAIVTRSDNDDAMAALDQGDDDPH